MRQDEWSRLKELFQEALTRAGQDRMDYVAGACRAYPHLEAPLRELVASDASAGDFMETPVFAAIDDGKPADVIDALGPGDIIDDTYEVQSTLGSGGMGVVYRVLHRALKRSFAAKVIHASVAGDSGFVERFEREAVALGRLKHPNIVGVTDYGVERRGSERAYLIMDCLAGVTLAERLRSGPIPAADAIPLLEPIAAGLDYAHAQGVLHLDLKPANVLLDDRDSGPIDVRILDFGLAQFTSDRGTASANTPLAGTPAYLAPELVDQHPADTAADIYAFGVLIYEILTGRPPFQGTVAEILDQQRRALPMRPSAVNAEVPADLDDVLLDLLAKDPAARPATAHDALSRLRSALTTHQQRAWRHTELPRRALVSAAIAVTLGGLSPFLYAWTPLQRLELMTVDARYAAAPSRPASRDIVLLMLDEASSAADPTPLVQRADAFGRDLQRILAAGAQAVAVDFVLPQSWSESNSFTRLVLEHTDRLILAAYSSPEGKVVGPECIAGTTAVALGPERAAALFGFINLDQDVDGVSRRGRLFFRDRDDIGRPSFAASIASISRQEAVTIDGAGRDDPFWIDHRIQVGDFTRISWKDLDAVLQERPDAFRNRIVLAGADYAGAGDEQRVPVRGVVAGVTLHAATVQTILDDFPVRGVGPAGLFWLSAMGSAFFSGVSLVLRRTFAAVVTAVAGVIGLLASAATLAWSGLMLPVVVPVMLGCVAGAAGYAIARKRAPYPADETPST